MRECPQSEELIRRLVEGGIPESDWESLHEHAGTCDDCRQILEVHRELSELGRDVPEPADNDFRVMRMNVMATLARQRPSGWRTFWQDLGFFLRAQPAGAVLVVAVLVAGAVYFGRSSAAPSRIDNRLLMSTIRAQAAMAGGVDEFWDTPFAYSNVSVRPLPGGQLALGFDVSWHVDVVTRQESAVARDVLMHAILEPAPVGNRLKAMGLTEQITDPNLRDAVVFALHHDPNVAVRLKAFEVLRQYPFDSSVQEALLATLKTDESVQMRFQALEYLAARRVSPDMLRRTIDEGGLESDPAVLQRAIELAQRS